MPIAHCTLGMNLQDVLQNILQVGAAVGMEREASDALSGLQARLAAVDDRVAKHFGTTNRKSKDNQ